jgi:hypothetical protein
LHAVEEDDCVGTYTTGGGAVLVDEVGGVPSGVESIELGAGTGATGCGNGRSWSGVIGRAGVAVWPGALADGLPGCCALSCAATAVAVHEITTAQKNRGAFFMTELRSL